MKILEIIQFFGPQWGGSVNYVYNLVKHLVKRGHELTIFTTDDNFDAAYAASLAPARVVVFPSQLGPLRYSPKMKRALEQIVADYDVVHLNNYWSYQNVIAAQAAVKHNIPYILSPHGSLPIMMKSQLKKMIFNLLFGEKMLQNAQKVVAVSDMESRQLVSKNVSSDKIAIIPNAIDTTKVKEAAAGMFRKKYALAANDKIVMFLGRIHKIKGLALLMRAWAKVTEKMSDARLVIVGPDESYLHELQKEVERLNIHDKIIITGPLYGEEKCQALTDADVFVYPSQYEIFGIAVIEACACGTPVVVTKNQGIASYIEGRAGEVVPENEAELSQALLALLADDKKRAQYAEQGKKLVEDLFTWDKIINQYENIFREIISKNEK